MAEDEKPVEGAAPLSDADLTDVAGGAETSVSNAYYCLLCGSKCGVTHMAYAGFTVKCPKCGVLKKAQYKRVEITKTIDGEFHSVSGEF